MQGLVDDMLERARPGRQMDVALPLPAAVISHVLGVPDRDREHFVTWSNTALALQGSQRPSLDVPIQASNAYAALQDYFAALIDERRRYPSVADDHEDFVIGLLDASDANPQISGADLILSCITLLIGGYETTTSLIANTVVLLLQRPSLLDALRRGWLFVGARHGV